MSNENNPVKPDCPLIGENGNIINLVGIAARTLKRNGLYEQANEQNNNSEQPVLHRNTISVFGNGAVEKTRRDWHESGTSCADSNSN